MLTQYLKHLVMNTPLETILKQARHVANRRQLLIRPELGAIHDEPGYIDAACRLLLTPESNTIDVGAHLGSQLAVFTQLARHGQHMAFEPVPHKARWLRSKFPRVDVRETALCDVSGGPRNFYVNITHPGYSGLRPHAIANDVMREITIEQSTLDAAVAPNHHVDLIKIDVEGAELTVLRGAEQLLARCRPTLLFESTRSALREYGITPTEMFQFLEQRGYQLYLPRAFVCFGRALEQSEFLEAHEYPFLAFNFIACAKERTFGRRRVHQPQPEQTVRHYGIGARDALTL
jgi:FkbM family methyltransferase